MKSFYFRVIAYVIIAFVLIAAAFKFTQPRLLWFENSEHTERGEGFSKTRFFVSIPSLANRSLNFQIDGCISELLVNQVSVWGPMRTNYCKRDGIFTLDLTEFLHDGANEIFIVGKKAQQETGLATFSLPRKTASFIFFYGLLGFVFALGFAWLWSGVFPKAREGILVFVGSLMAYLYLILTPWDIRAYDPIDHLEYIQTILQNFKIPDPAACWQCFQAPGYYLIGAYVTTLASTFFQCLNFSLVFLQCTSLVLMFLFLIGIRKIFLELKLFNQSKVFILFLVMLPSFFIHAVRVGNDVLLYLANIYFLLFALRFWNRPTRRSLWSCFALLALSLLSKATALVAVFAFGVIFIYKFWKEKKTVDKFVAPFVMGMLLLGVVYFMRSLLNGGPTGFSMNQMPDFLRIHSNFYHFLIPDVTSFFHDPAAAPRDFESGREFFWNYFLKSFSHGEFAITNKVNIILGNLRNVFTAGLFCYAAYCWIPRDTRQKAFPVFIYSLSMIGALMAFRIYHPYSPSADARLVYPGALMFLSSLVWARNPYVKKTLAALSLLGIIFWISFFVTTVY